MSRSCLLDCLSSHCAFSGRMKSELKLSRRENLFQCPGIVLAVAGYLLTSFASLFLLTGLRGTSFEPNISLFLLLPFEIFFLMNLYPAMTGGDRKKIYSVQFLLMAEAIYIGIRHIYAAIEYPYIGVLEYPRPFFSGYVGTFSVAVGQLVAVVTWCLLLFAPNVRRWVRGGVQSEGEAIELRSDRLSGAESSSKRGLGGWGLVRLLGCLSFGAAVYSVILFSGSVLGRNVLPPDKLSFEELIDQLGTKDHWQLRLRHHVGFLVAQNILNYSSAKSAERPPTTVHGLRAEAMDGLVRFGSRAVGPLEQVLTDSNVSLRRVAVESLGEIGAEAAAASGSLHAMVLDSELPVRSARNAHLEGDLLREIVLALIKIGPDDPRNLETIFRVFDIAKGPGLRFIVEDLTSERGLEQGTGQRQIERLLSGGNEATQFYILRDLRSMDKNRSSRRERFQLWHSLVALVTELLAHPEPAIRRESALLLSGIKPSSIALVEQMRDLVSDKHPAVSRAAIHAFERWNGYNKEVSLANFLSQLNDWKRSGASLEESEYWEDSTSMVRPAEFMSYGRHRGILVKHSSHISLSEFGILFSASNPQSAYRRVKQKLSEMLLPNEFERITTRRMVIRALGVQGRRAEEAVPLLKEIVASEEAPERWEAAISLWKISGNANEALSIFGPFIDRLKTIQPDDPRYPILSNAIDAFGDMGAPALPILSELLKLSDNGLRLKAYIEIEELLPSNPAARGIVESLVDDSHGVIRLRAQKAIKKLDEGL